MHRQFVMLHMKYSGNYLVMIFFFFLLQPLSLDLPLFEISYSFWDVLQKFPEKVLEQTAINM